MAEENREGEKAGGGIVKKLKMEKINRCQSIPGAGSLDSELERGEKRETAKEVGRRNA